MNAAHNNALLQRHRCGRCAEPISAALALRGGVCPHCEATVAWQRGDALEATDRRAEARVLYLILGIASLIAGFLPLVQSLVFVLALVVAQLTLLRPLLRWLGGARRLFARLTVKLFAAALASLNLVIDVLVAPYFGVRAPILAIWAVLGLVIYLELSQSMLRRRLALEQAGAPLRAGEWLLPVGVLGSLLVILGLGALALLSAWRLLETHVLPLLPSPGG